LHNVEDGESITLLARSVRLETLLDGEVTLHGDVRQEVPLPVVHWRDGRVLFVQFTTLSAIDQGAVPGLSTIEVSPHDLEERVVVELTLKEPRFRSEDLGE
jgi:hypothetical protein